MKHQLNVSNGQIRTIRLYGKLGTRFGRVHHMSVGSAAEAVRALGSQLRGFNAFLTKSKDMGLAYAVFYGKNNLSKEEMRLPANKQDIRIAPMVIGRKSQGIVSIVLGIVLIVIGVVIGVGSGGTAGLIAGALVKMGVAMIIGGIVQLLAPSPKGRSAKDRPENTPSYLFNGPINTQAQGNPVPVLFGELIVGSAVVSAGINVKDQVFIPTNGGFGGGTGSGGGGGGGSAPWHGDWYTKTHAL